MDLTPIPIVDHHAHPFLRKAVTENLDNFRSWFTESTSPEIHAQHVRHSLFYRNAIRWLAEMLDCEPNEQAVTDARIAQDEAAWIRRLFTDANISVLLCDYGYGSSDAYDHARMQELVPCRVEPILRLERMAEGLILGHATFEQMLDAYVEKVEQARSDGYVALKSIIAYRTGLRIEQVSRADAAVAFAVLKEEARRHGRIRLAKKPLCDYLVKLALDIANREQMPIQFHTGFGDSDADLRGANPLQLRAVIEGYPNLPLVLLHAGWPFYREMAHLAAIYPNVWADLSLAIPFATAGIPAMLRDMIGMAPISKLLFATDAYTMPEIYWLAARWGRWGLGRVLDELVADSFLQEQEAWRAAEDILGENAKRLYLGAAA